MSTPEKEHEKTVKACLIFHVNLQKGQIFHVPALASLLLITKRVGKAEKMLDIIRPQLCSELLSR